MTERKLIEAAVCGVALIAICRQQSVAALLRGLSPAYRVFLIVLVVLVIAAHVHGRKTKTFPFVDWTMYGTRCPGDPHHYEYHGFQPGSRQPIVLNPYLVSFCSRQLPLVLAQQQPAALVKHQDQLRYQWRLHACWDNLGKPEYQAQIESGVALLRRLTAHYNKHCPGTAVTHIDVIKCTTPLHDNMGKNAVRRERVFTVAVDAAAKER